MSELKVGDIVFYNGNKGIIRDIFDDENNAKLHRVDVTKTGIHYLYAQELDLYFPSLTDDQQVVLEWLKKKTDSYPDVSYLVGDLNYFAVTPVGQAWKRLSKAEQFQVLAAFASYGLEDNQ